jgi:hypothetical protein
MMGRAGAPWPFHDGPPISQSAERDRLAAQFGRRRAWRDEYLRRAVRNCRRALLGEAPQSLIGPAERTL